MLRHLLLLQAAPTTTRLLVQSKHAVDGFPECLDNMPHLQLAVLDAPAATPAAHAWPGNKVSSQLVCLKISARVSVDHPVFVHLLQQQRMLVVLIMEGVRSASQLPPLQVCNATSEPGQPGCVFPSVVHVTWLPIPLLMYMSFPWTWA